MPELNEWIERKHGELDYYFTQMLAGHGTGSIFINTHVEDPFCRYCSHKTENAKMNYWTLYVLHNK